MCGIVGLIKQTALSEANEAAVRHLSKCIEHRGPDGEGTYAANGFMMAMRRLAIIDLAGGWQPLYNEDQSIALMANGEVYNFVELRRELEGHGHVFRTKSDCETIIHAYEELGDDCVHKLRGMYAFCLYDSRKRRILLARDRMGEKPLFLVERKGEIWFSSELKALIASRVLPYELDLEAAWEFFHYSYVPEPRAPVVGARKLPPANLMTIELDSWTIKQRRYWNMEDAPPIEGDPPKVIREEIDRIFELIVRSDVPIGISLSSGIDSSAIAALAQKNFPGTIHAFTVGYEGEPRQDERSMAREFCKHANIPFHGIELKDEQVVEDYPNMIWSRGELISDFAGSGYLAVMREARKAGFPVMLLGHGGDELFWGYPWVRDAYRRCFAKLEVRTGHGTISSYLRVTKPPRSIRLGLRWLRGGGGLVSGIKDFLVDRKGDPDQLVFYDHSPEFRIARERLPHLLHKNFLDLAGDFDLGMPYRRQQPWKHVDIQYVQMISMSYLLANGLAQCDRLSMAASVEGRMPLIDYKLVETVIGLMKTHPTKIPAPKAWLRQALSDVVPQFVFKRPKTGFNSPHKRWATKLSKRYGEMLADGELVRERILPRGLSPEVAGMDTLTIELWCRKMREASQAALPSEPIVIEQLASAVGG